MFSVSLSNFYKELNYFILDDGFHLRFCNDNNHKYNQYLSKPVSAFDNLIDKLISEVESDIDHVIFRQVFGPIKTLKLLKEVILIRGLNEQSFNCYTVEFADNCDDLENKELTEKYIQGRLVVRWSKEKVFNERLKKQGSK